LGGVNASGLYPGAKDGGLFAMAIKEVVVGLIIGFSINLVTLLILFLSVHPL